MVLSCCKNSHHYLGITSNVGDVSCLNCLHSYRRDIMKIFVKIMLIVI